MALITEDGTGRADAESYISVTDADTYHGNRGNASWAALSATQKEEALRKATDYMVQVYRSRWAGLRMSATQALDWPRYEVPRADFGDYYPSNAVPSQVKYACAELAIKAAAGTALAADLAAPATRVKVGPIEKEFDPNARQTTIYRAVDGLLRPFLARGESSLSVVRV